MGLDMYLNRKVYVRNWNHMDDKKKVTVRYMGKGEDTYRVHPIFKGRKPEISEVVEEVMYWRKANAIHQWFVNNIQNGHDDCGSYYVELDDLKRLLDEVNQVLADPSVAPDILPTTSGFFFGSTEYGDWYMEDMKNTQKALKRILKEHEKAVAEGMPIYDVSYEYSSSW